MNDARQIAATIDNYRRQGRYIIVKMAGPCLVSIETFSDEGAAMQAFTTLTPESPNVMLITPKTP